MPLPAIPSLGKQLPQVPHAIRQIRFHRGRNEPHTRLLEDMNLTDEKILLALRLLIEGNS